MKKWRLILAAGIMVIGCAGCGAAGTEDTKSSDNVISNEAQAESGATEGETAESEAEAKNDNYDDLTEKGENGEITAFAEEIQTAVSTRNLEALADLCSYPLAVNGEVVENKDAFMELGEDDIFTAERCAVIAAVDVSALEETMAGVIMGNATPNIIFKSVDGELGITGIN